MLVHTKIVKLFLSNPKSRNLGQTVLTKRCLYVFILFVLCTSTLAEKGNDSEQQMDPELDLQALVDDVMDYSHYVGSALRSKDQANRSDIYAVAPVTLFPSLVPRKPFEEANTVHESLALLYYRISNDFEFVAETLKGADRTVQILVKFARQAIDEGHQSPIKLLVTRADYMFHENKEATKDEDKYELKQIEVNAGPVGGVVNDNVTKLHARMLDKAGMPAKGGVLPPNNGTDTLARGFYTAWQKFGHPEAIMILVHEERSTIATPEQRQLQYEIERISKRKMKIVRISLQDSGKRLKLADDFSLYLDDKMVAIVYFRISFMVRRHADESVTRRLVERSTAIKVPSLPQELAASKKIQQVLAQPGMVEKFLPEPEHAENVVAIRKTFAGLWGLDGDDEETKAIIEHAIAHPERYVLKPNREGGGHNIWGQEIADKLKEFTYEQRAEHILMQKLEPLVVQNYFVRPNTKVEFGDVISEISIFGALVGDVSINQVHYNRGHGHMMRTKWAHFNEGGILKGTGVYDSPYLF